MDEQRDDGDEQKKMDQSTCHMENQESSDPKKEENDGNQKKGSKSHKRSLTLAGRIARCEHS
jgi:hypothetical protein